MIKNYIFKKLAERTTIDGVVLIAAGIGFIVFKPLGSIIAYAAIGYGVYTILKNN
jgi:hypothetical protein